MRQEEYIKDLAQAWVNIFKSDDFQTFAYEEGYKKGFQDAITRAYCILLNHLQLPDPRNHDLYNIEVLEARSKYAKTFAEWFEKKMNEDPIDELTYLK